MFLSHDVNVGQNMITNLRISESGAFKRGWNVAIKSTSNVRLEMRFTSIASKILKFISHPFRYSKRIFQILINNI